MSIFFDESYYLTQNPDVLQAIVSGAFTSPIAGVSAARYHFDTYGWKEMRDPSASFDTSFYLQNNLDVLAAGVNPYEHFINNGAAEGRVPNQTLETALGNPAAGAGDDAFDAASYLAANADVQAAVTAGSITAYQHWVLYGQFENRSGAQTVGGTDLSNAGGNAGTSFVMTTAADAFTGTANNDTFTGVVSSNTGETTLSALDSIAGGSGVDTLNVTLNGTATSVVNGANVSGVEVLNVRNVGTGAAAVDASQLAGLTTIASDRSTGTVAATNLATGATFEVIGNGTVANGNTGFQYKTATDAVSLSIKGGATAGNINVGAVGGAATGTATSATIKSSGAANTVGTVDLANSTLTSVTINAESNLKGDFLSQATDQVGANGAVTISGAATSVEFTAALDNTIKTIDASGLTAGGLKASLGTGTEDYKGGAGVDTIVLNTGVKTATFGAGNDVVTTAAVNTTTAGAISGGDGTDTLVIAAATDVDSAAKRGVFTGFETLRNTAAGASIDVSGFSGITSVEVEGNKNTTFTKLSAAQAAAVKLVGTTVATDVTLSLATATGTSDVATVTIGDTKTDSDLQNLTVNGFETVNIVSAGTKVGTDLTVTKIISDSATAINFSGSVKEGTNAKLVFADTSGLTKAVAIDASAIDGSLTLGGTDGTLVKGSSVKATAQADTITTVATAVAGVQGEFVTYDAGAGDDTINTTLTALNNTNNAQASLKIDGGAGTDTVVFAAADATFADARFQYVTNVEKITLANTTNLSFTSGGFFDTNFKAAGVTLTTGTLADAATANIDLASFTGAAKVVATSSGVGDAAGEDLVINTGIGADDVSLTASSWTGAAGASSNITIGTGAGADKISLTIGNLAATTSGDIVINGGTGADAITVSHTNDTTATALISFKVADGDSTAAARDKITGFLKADATDRSDVLDFDTANVAANTAGTNGTDSGTIKSHAITNGIITFDDIDSFTTALTVNESNLSDVLAYVAANISTAGDTVAFAYDSNNDGTADATMVFNQGASDSVVELVGVTGVTAIGASAVTANLVAIA